MSDVSVQLNVNVIGCGQAGEVVTMASKKAALLIERGRAELVGASRAGKAAAVPAPAGAAVEWPPNSGISVTRPELAEIAKHSGVKVEWLEAAANRIRSADAIPTQEILAVIAERAALRKEVLALAEAYVVHEEMAARFAVLAAQGAPGAPNGAEGDQVGQGAAQGATGGLDAEAQE